MTRSGRSSPPSPSPKPLATSPKASSPTPSASSTPKPSSATSKRPHPPSQSTSSTLSSSPQSEQPTRVPLTLTTKFTCPLCSEEHTQNSRWSLSTKPKTSHLLITRYSTTSRGAELSLLVTPTSPFMALEARFSLECPNSKPTSP